MANLNSERVTVLGAGVIGLTCALVLAEAGYVVDVVARDLPEDSNSSGFASPWAGADWYSFAPGPDSPEARWETVSFKKIWDLIPQGLAMKLESKNYFLDPLEGPRWIKDIVPNYRVLDASELPVPELKAGDEHDTWSINPPEYIKWLGAKLRILGVPIVRQMIKSIDEPFLTSFSGAAKPASIVINASSLGAKSLVGVEDQDLFPIRGQIVFVWAPHYTKTITRLKPDGPPVYAIPRPNGEVALGGTFLPNDWNLAVDPKTTEEIVKNCLYVDPSISHDGSGPENLPITNITVGLRPARKGGPRVEREEITVPLQPRAFKPRPSAVHAGLQPRQVDVIHAYGFGPAGFQMSWGVAEDVLGLVKETIERRKQA
ncbi:nucleotide-binding domain-containing protein [Clavulina sp. PMI_390]|nr:nucleotide-binding domain-containing protein [Clavulina sp. PMI_390]